MTNHTTTTQALEELLGEYWVLAYSEGKDGVSHGDKANEVLHKLRTMYRAAPSPTSVAEVNVQASELEDFEDWAKREGLIQESFGIRSVNSMCDVARRAYQAGRAAISQPPAVQVPPGCRLVPIDPDAMQVARGELAFLDAEEYQDGADVRECQVIDIYRAMVDASPSPAAVRVEEVPDYEAKFQHEVTELVMRHIDRMNDVCEQDTADQIIESFTSQFAPIFETYISAKFPNRRVLLSPASQKTEGGKE